MLPLCGIPTLYPPSGLAIDFASRDSFPTRLPCSRIHCQPEAARLSQVHRPYRAIKALTGGLLCHDYHMLQAAQKMARMSLPHQSI